MSPLVEGFWADVLRQLLWNHRVMWPFSHVISADLSQFEPYSLFLSKLWLLQSHYDGQDVKAKTLES